MSTTRTALRSLGVIAAASGLALAGAGAASATTATSDVDGKDVSVTFTLEEGDDGDACGSALIPPAALAEVLAELGGGTPEAELTAQAIPDFGDLLGDLLAPLQSIPGVTLLTSGDTPFVVLTTESPAGTVSAEDVQANLYLQANFCASDFMGGSDFTPDVKPVLVGNPLEAISSMSADGLVETGSALLGAGGDDGLGAVLSSALGGGEE